MSTKPPRPEQPKTECMYCGLIWQDHTIREYSGCMTLVRISSRVAEADRVWKGEAVPTDRLVLLCPVCQKRSDEHGDVTPCLVKWRKREQGSTGLERQNMFEWHEVHFTNEVTDPVQAAQLMELWMQSICPCGKARGDHTWDEMIGPCAPLNRSR